MLSAALALICGCDEGEYEQVSYAPSPLVGPVQTIAIPDGRAGISADDAPRIVFTGPIKRNAAIVFEGRLKPSTSRKAGGAVIVEFHIGLANGERMTVGEAIATPVQDSDGWLQYRVEMHAPPDANKCAVEILYVRELVAAGEVSIE